MPVALLALTFLPFCLRFNIIGIDPIISNDSKKAQQLFYDEVNAFIALSLKMKQIFYCLLHDAVEFEAFFEYIDFYCAINDAETLIKSEFAGKIVKMQTLKRLLQEIK